VFYHVLPSIFFWIAGGIAIFFGILLIYSSLAEKQTRPFVLTLILSILFTGIWFLIYFWGKGRSSIWTAAGGLMTLLILLFVVPIGKKKTIVIRPNDERYDERDTIFARFDLEPETERYERYYQNHPEYKAIDDKLRLLPRLLSPGGRYFHPVRSKFVEVMFEQERHNVTNIDGPISAEPVPLSRDAASGLVKETARHLGAADAGVAELSQCYVYSHVGSGPEEWGSPIDNSHRFVVVFTVEMRLEKVNQAPSIGITEETAQQYLQSQHVSVNLAAFIRRLGYSARAHISGSNYQIILPAVAYQAGLGELGRCGFLIAPQYGARVRLGAVTTDLPLTADSPVNLGVQDFCARCKKCAVNCPSGAIPAGGKTEVRGVNKWQLKSAQCYRYWCLIGTDCGLCMKVCPFSHPDTPFHSLLRAGVKRSALVRRIALWGDDLFYGKKFIPKSG